MELSKQTKRVLGTLTGWFENKNYPPSLRELAKNLGFTSTWPVRYHINKLAGMGYVKFTKGIARGIELAQEPGKSAGMPAGIPILGRISAGLPVSALENMEGYLDLKNMFNKTNDTFALRVKGDSMSDAGIFAGDIALVRRQETAINGDLVVAMIGEEALLKKFYLSKDEIKLQPANPGYKPILTKNARILGKVIAILRRY